jgi:hypothetical protein
MTQAFTVQVLNDGSTQWVNDDVFTNAIAANNVARWLVGPEVPRVLYARVKLVTTAAAMFAPTQSAEIVQFYARYLAQNECTHVLRANELPSRPMQPDEGWLVRMFQTLTYTAPAAEPVTLYERLKAAGVPLDSHCSDLYAKITPAATAIIVEWQRANKTNVSIFRSLLDNDVWYDIPFAYDPYWTKASWEHDFPKGKERVKVVLVEVLS